MRPVCAADAGLLFPMIFQTRVTDAILWDGPESLAAYQEGLAEKEAATRAGRQHMFTLFYGSQAAGSASFRLYAEDPASADIGLWIGEPFQGKGLGTFVIKELVSYGFQMPNIQKIEASVFVGNLASRRIMEKNGFRLTGQAQTEKRGQRIEEWVFARERENETHYPLEK